MIIHAKVGTKKVSARGQKASLLMLSLGNQTLIGNTGVLSQHHGRQTKRTVQTILNVNQNDGMVRHVKEWTGMFFRVKLERVDLNMNSKGRVKENV